MLQCGNIVLLTIRFLDVESELTTSLKCTYPIYVSILKGSDDDVLYRRLLSFWTSMCGILKERDISKTRSISILR
jgi:hypothetical protein